MSLLCLRTLCVLTCAVCCGGQDCVKAMRLPSLLRQGSRQFLAFINQVSWSLGSEL